MTKSKKRNLFRAAAAANLSWRKVRNPSGFRLKPRDKRRAQRLADSLFGDIVVHAGYMTGGPRVQVWVFNPVTGQRAKVRDFFLIETEFRGGYFPDELRTGGQEPTAEQLALQAMRIVPDGYDPQFRGGQRVAADLDGFHDLIFAPGLGSTPIRLQ